MPTSFNTQAGLGNYLQSSGINPNNQQTLSGVFSPPPAPSAQHQSPTTPVKSITTNADGSSTSTYHAPTAGIFSSGNSAPEVGVSSPSALQNAGIMPQPDYDTTTGFLTAAGKAAGKPAVQPGDPSAPQAGVSQTAPGTNANNGTNFGQNLGNVAASGNQTNNEQQTYQGLLGQSQAPSAAYNTAMGNYNTANTALADYNQQLAATDKNINAQGISLDSSRGQLANTAQAATGEEAALQGAVTGASNVLGAANTQQGLQVQAGTAANAAAQTTAQRNLTAQGDVAGLTQPMQVSPSNTLVSPTTGTGIYGLGSTSGNGSSAYQNFANLQFNTQTGQALSKQANDLSTAATQTDQNFQTFANTIQGLNIGDYPDINSLSQAVQQHGGNAGQVSAMNEAYNALQTSLSQIISSGTSGLTPTTISSLTNNQAINTLSPAQLQTLYNTVKQTMATKINTLQQQAITAENAGTGFNNGASASSTANSLSGNTSGLYNF